MANQISFAIAAAEALEPRRAVFVSGSTATYCDSGANPVAGITQDFVEAAGDMATIITSGDFVCDASGPIAAGAPVIATTDGVLVDGSAQQTGWFVGRALTAQTGGRVRVQIAPWFAPADA